MFCFTKLFCLLFISLCYIFNIMCLFVFIYIRKIPVFIKQYFLDKVKITFICIYLFYCY